MPAALEGMLGEVALERISGHHRHRPRQIDVAQHLEIDVEGRLARRHPEEQVDLSGPAIARLAPEVEAQEGALRHGTGLRPGQRHAQEARLEDRHARPEPQPLAELELVGDVGGGVRVDPVRRKRHAVLTRRRQVDGARVDEPHAQREEPAERLEVAGLLLDRLSEDERRIEDRVREAGRDRLEMLEVEARARLAGDGDVGGVGVDDRGAGLEAADRVGHQRGLGLGDVGIAAGRGRPVQGDLEDDGLVHDHLSAQGEPGPRAPGRFPTRPNGRRAASAADPVSPRRPRDAASRPGGSASR